MEAQVRADIADLGPLAGIQRSLAEIVYTLARALDNEEVSAPAAVARELSNRIQSLAVMTGGVKGSKVDELAARRASAQAAARAQGS